MSDEKSGKQWHTRHPSTTDQLITLWRKAGVDAQASLGPLPRSITSNVALMEKWDKAAATKPTSAPSPFAPKSDEADTDGGENE